MAWYQGVRPPITKSSEKVDKRGGMSAVELRTIHSTARNIYADVAKRSPWFFTLEDAGSLAACSDARPHPARSARQFNCVQPASSQEAT